MQAEDQMAEQKNQDSEWPPEAGMILSALEAGGWNEERRTTRRMAYRVRAALRLFIDTPGSEQREIFTRDAHSRGLGFVTTHRLPLGYGGTVQIMAPNQKMITVQCTLLRCRQAAPGWYEGALHFVRDQGEFALPTED
jgi:hypothetical protein